MAVVVFFMAGCNKYAYDFDRALPVQSVYPKEITHLMSNRQKKYYHNIAAAVKEEGSINVVTAIAAAQSGKLNMEFLQFRSNYIRYSKYETAEHRANLTSAFGKILKGVKELNYNPPLVYWSPVASPGFAAFTTPLSLLNTRLSDGALIEISNAIEHNLWDLSNVLLNLAAQTYEKLENGKNIQGIIFREKNEIDSVIQQAKYFQRTFNTNLLEYFFYEKRNEPDSVFILNNNLTSLIAADDALLFICSHEYAHVLLNHMQQLRPVHFSQTDTANKSKNVISVGEVSISKEFAADSLGFLLCRKQTLVTSATGIAIALIWLDITERIQAIKYQYPVYLTHPPAKDRITALARQIKRLQLHNEKQLESFLYCYELLWKDFEPVLQQKLDRNPALSLP